MHFLTCKSIYCFKRVLYSTYIITLHAGLVCFLLYVSLWHKILLWVWIYLLHSLFMTELCIFQFIPFKCFIIIPFSNWSNSDLSVSLLLCKVTTPCFSFNVCFLLTCLHQNCNFEHLFKYIQSKYKCYFKCKSKNKTNSMNILQSLYNNFSPKHHPNLLDKASGALHV